MIKDTYTKEEVIKLLTEERTRARDIAYAFKKKHDLEIEAFKNLKLQDSASAGILAMKHKNKSEVARLIGNTISGSTGLTPDDETIEDRIRKSLENNNL